MLVPHGRRVTLGLRGAERVPVDIGGMEEGEVPVVSKDFSEERQDVGTNGREVEEGADDKDDRRLPSFPYYLFSFFVLSCKGDV